MLKSFAKHLVPVAVLVLATIPFSMKGQDQVKQWLKDPIEIHGNFSAATQYYFSDSAIGAPDVPEKLLLNGFGNVIIDKGPFSAGFRYESYLNPILGFDARYQGSGIPYRYFTFHQNGLEVTAGNFYEQFGSGMLLRSYEERDLGLDNAFDGMRVRYKMGKGIYLKGLIGRQRYFFDLSEGIVRAFDGEVALNEMFDSMKKSKLKVKIGGSFVSKYQADDNPNYVLPENVGAYGGRLTLNYKNFAFFAEYSYKENDPSFDNNYIYKPGHGLYLSGSYSRKGLGINLTAKTVDNMSFRSDRDETLTNVMINYMPALTKQHTYNLAATLYPYATQPTGETAFQADIFFKLKKKTWYGGKYGTRVELNASKAFGLDSTQLHDETTNRMGYEAPFFSMGTDYYQDINITVTRKMSKWFKVKAMYMNLMVNNKVMNFAGLNGKFAGNIYADIAVLDMLFKLNHKHSIRTEIQGLWSDQDQGDWATLVVEYTFSPHWFAAVMDQFNYGNPIAGNRIHYPYATFGYTNKSNRISLGYGRQKAGLFCIGGVCRQVPASNGFTLTVTSSF
ncbi:hypothetical protein KFE98_04765 [bacterium SCSIO 12741]|nr:hypothetical protein KFE98_04765 [bacterium SCSIO 12741]